MTMFFNRIRPTRATTRMAVTTAPSFPCCNKQNAASLYILRLLASRSFLLLIKNSVRYPVAHCQTFSPHAARQPNICGSVVERGSFSLLYAPREHAIGRSIGVVRTACVCRRWYWDTRSAGYLIFKSRFTVLSATAASRPRRTSCFFRHWTRSTARASRTRIVAWGRNFSYRDRLLLSSTSSRRMPKLEVNLSPPCRTTQHDMTLTPVHARNKTACVDPCMESAALVERCRRRHQMMHRISWTRNFWEYESDSVDRSASIAADARHAKQRRRRRISSRCSSDLKQMAVHVIERTSPGNADEYLSNCERFEP
eukprot:284819027_2